jgi:hypothetical protein
VQALIEKVVFSYALFKDDHRYAGFVAALQIYLTKAKKRVTIFAIEQEEKETFNLIPDSGSAIRIKLPNIFLKNTG